MIKLLILCILLLVLELVYFKIADKFNIIDKPNERSSHSSIVLRVVGPNCVEGGGKAAFFLIESPFSLSRIALALKRYMNV